MRLLILFCALTVCTFAKACHGFSAPCFAAPFSSPTSSTPTRRDFAITAHAFPSDEESDSRVDIKNLLTQRSIQSFLFLCESVRDPHSVKWIEDFLDAPNQLEYHGTGAAYMEKFGGCWDGPLLAMLEREKEVIVVSARRSGKGHRGWSKNNPYLEDRFVDFQIDIDPVSLANRILSVREQLAREWKADLDILAHANDQILMSYTRLSRDERQKKDTELTRRPPAFQRTAPLAMEQMAAPLDASPLRKGNFDLLCNLCTQASVHRLLRQLQNSDQTEKTSFDWLLTFYSDRLNDYFDGHQDYGRADDFLEEILLTPPSILESSASDFVDPMRIAEELISIRNDIANEWKNAMEEVPQEHTSGIRKILLEKQMAAWGSSTPLGDEGAKGAFE